mmetsp:Transcript_12371/g.42876  ORF Transcript_12371/g.42876 Transcript_12371/m.42876 type:complete len:504 (+) Transcript_12371:1588-3099(+)
MAVVHPRVVLGGRLGRRGCPGLPLGILPQAGCKAPHRRPLPPGALGPVRHLLHGVLQHAVLPGRLLLRLPEAVAQDPEQEVEHHEEHQDHEDEAEQPLGELLGDRQSLVGPQLAIAERRGVHERGDGDVPEGVGGCVHVRRARAEDDGGGDRAAAHGDAQHEEEVREVRPHEHERRVHHAEAGLERRVGHQPGKDEHQGGGGEGPEGDVQLGEVRDAAHHGGELAPAPGVLGELPRGLSVVREPDLWGGDAFPSHLLLGRELPRGEEGPRHDARRGPGLVVQPPPQVALRHARRLRQDVLSALPVRGPRRHGCRLEQRGRERERPPPRVEPQLAGARHAERGPRLKRTHERRHRRLAGVRHRQLLGAHQGQHPEAVRLRGHGPEAAARALGLEPHLQPHEDARRGVVQHEGGAEVGRVLVHEPALQQGVRHGLRPEPRAALLEDGGEALAAGRRGDGAEGLGQLRARPHLGLVARVVVRGDALRGRGLVQRRAGHERGVDAVG